MRNPKHTDKTMQEVYEDTMGRLKVIENVGYVVEVIWEHEWNQLKREREEVREFVNRLELVDRLELRDSFFGGRTNEVVLSTRQRRRRRGYSVRGLPILVPLSQQKLCVILPS